MRKLIIITFLSVLCISSTQAQMNLSNATLYNGLSPLSSGLGTVINFSDGNNSDLSLEFNSTLAQFIYTKTYGSVIVGPSGGTQENTPWVAPFLIWNITDHISFTAWDGVFFGSPNEPDWDINFGFAYQAIDINFNNFGFGYSVLHYLEYKPMHLPTIRYNVSFGQNDKLLSSFTYELLEERPMFWMGWKHNF